MVNALAKQNEEWRSGKKISCLINTAVYWFLLRSPFLPIQTLFTLRTIVYNNLLNSKHRQQWSAWAVHVVGQTMKKSRLFECPRTACAVPTIVWKIVK